MGVLWVLVISLSIALGIARVEKEKAVVSISTYDVVFTVSYKGLTLEEMAEVETALHEWFPSSGIQILISPQPGQNVFVWPEMLFWPDMKIPIDSAKTIK